jgi:hypothetical protein
MKLVTHTLDEQVEQSHWRPISLLGFVSLSAKQHNREELLTAPDFVYSICLIFSRIC